MFSRVFFSVRVVSFKTIFGQALKHPMETNRACQFLHRVTLLDRHLDGVLQARELESKGN